MLQRLSYLYSMTNNLEAIFALCLPDRGLGPVAPMMVVTRNFALRQSEIEMWLISMRDRALAIGVLILLLCSVPLVSADEPAGRKLYLQHCASCHGAKLEGQPNWMVRQADGKLPAPPHDATGHTWHHSDAQLLIIVRDGLAALAPGYATDMPAFASTLTDDEIRAVLGYIKISWTERQRQSQKSRSE